MKTKRKRKNPKLENKPLTYQEYFQLKSLIVNAIVNGCAIDLARAKRLFVTGFCTDCGEKHCICELCEDCNLPTCMCPDFSIGTFDSIQVMNKAWNFAKEIFNQKDLLEIKNAVFSRYKRYPSSLKLYENLLQ